MQKRLFLLDGYALIYRAYYALIKAPLINSKGMNTSAVRGFASTLMDIIQKENPTHLAIAFDPLEYEGRAAEFSFYKANREAMPEDIRKSLPYIQQLAAAMKIPVLRVEGYEADDIVGTIAKKAEQDDFQVFMVTSDKDYGQLVSEKVFLYKPPYLKKPRQILGIPEILKEWDISRTEQLIDILGLMGDAVDNIPGIKGVGKKTAAKLIKQFDTVENMLQNTHQIKGKLREKVEVGAQDALISKKLATIICNVPLEYKPDSYLLEEFDAQKLTELFEELEFKTIARRILNYAKTNDSYVNEEGKQKAITNTGSSQLGLFDQVFPSATSTTQAVAFSTKLKTIDTVTHDYQIADTIEKRQALLDLLLKQNEVCFDTETSALNANLAELVGLAFCFKKHTGWYVPIPSNQTAAQAIVHEFKPFFEATNITKVGQNLKYDILILKWYDVTIKGQLADTMIAHALLEPEQRHNLTHLSETYLNYTPIAIETLIGKKGKNQKSMRQIAVDVAARYAIEDADLTWQIHQYLTPKIQDSPYQKLYAETEIPLVQVLADMEHEGIGLNTQFLNDYSAQLLTDLQVLQTKIHEQAGVPFNIDSPKQMGDVLFQQMNIPYPGKKTKTGRYSTNEATLLKLENKYPIIDDILDYRELRKLRNTYVEALPKLINPKSRRLHTTYNQTAVKTGRLSSFNPNLQNIPIRTERGRKIRQAFIPRDENHVLMAADYSQIELRLMAAMSNDPNMKQAFIDGLDIHTATAARIYHTTIDKVDKTMRRKAKMVNFGIIYGISAFGLAQRLNIKRGEAKAIIDEYFKQYVGIQDFMEAAVKKVQATGYAETILGRRRYLKDIHSSNRTVRQFAERNAINSPIQGSAADMIKIAMVNIYAELRQRNWRSRMILQVHDELVFDVYKPELTELKALVINKMQNALTLSVPIKVEVGVGQDWLEAH